eukprot:365022-Chlamydomonas_euryale.AAC.12
MGMYGVALPVWQASTVTSRFTVRCTVRFTVRCTVRCTVTSNKAWMKDAPVPASPRSKPPCTQYCHLPSNLRFPPSPAQPHPAVDHRVHTCVSPRLKSALPCVRLPSSSAASQSMARSSCSERPSMRATVEAAPADGDGRDASDACGVSCCCRCWCCGVCGSGCCEAATSAIDRIASESTHSNATLNSCADILAAAAAAAASAAAGPSTRPRRTRDAAAAALTRCTPAARRAFDTPGRPSASASSCPASACTRGGAKVAFSISRSVDACLCGRWGDAAGAGEGQVRCVETVMAGGGAGVWGLAVMQRGGARTRWRGLVKGAGEG